MITAMKLTYLFITIIYTLIPSGICQIGLSAAKGTWKGLPLPANLTICELTLNSLISNCIITNENLPHEPRYIYNAKTKMCDVIKWHRPCGPIPNVFYSLIECQLSCNIYNGDTISECDLVPRGDCILDILKPSKRRFYFNTTLGECDFMSWALSCYDGPNVFTSFKECQRECLAPEALKEENAYDHF